MRPVPQFGDDITNVANNDPNLPVVMHCTRMAGRAIIRVVGRCNDAQENNKLDLSDCQLMQIPDAVYHLMRNTILETCDLSTNSITRIGAKFAEKFPVITELNLANNRISTLPEQLSDLSQLRSLDISHNALIALPPVTLKMPALEVLSVTYNRIISVEVENIKSAPSLRRLDMRENPVSDPCRAELTAECHVICISGIDDADEALEKNGEHTRATTVVFLSAPEDDEDWNV
ncbi:hypothetical protein B566_EDAN001013 [Ephemera danica]|nr:hypothetical protein B566_EDAN001013 [Ephemera danica]